MYPPVAAVLGCALLTGVGAVQNSASARPGDSVAVLGLGGVGMAAVIGAGQVGAWPIIAVDPVESKRDLAQRLGATVSVHPDCASDVIKDLTGGGVDVVIEAAGSVAVLAEAIDLATIGGQIIAVGLPSPDSRTAVSPSALVARGLTLKGSYMGDSIPDRDIRRLLKSWESDRLPLHELVTSELALADINECFDRLADGNEVRQIVRFELEDG